MTSRELVHSPDELRGGDRVEVDCTTRTVRFDCLWFGPAPTGYEGVLSPGTLVWHVYAHDLAAGVVSPFQQLHPLIYRLGRVFIRRRAREDQVACRVREVQRG